MVGVSRLAIPLAFALFLAPMLAGCMEGFVDPTCPPTMVGAAWTQEGVWVSMPDEGLMGAYNVSYPQREGFAFEDPEWGPLVLSSVRLDPGWDQNDTEAFFVLDVDGRVHLSVAGTVEEDEIRHAFVDFATSVTGLSEQDVEPFLDRLLENRLRDVRSSSSEFSSRAAQVTEATMQEYSVSIDGPYRFEALYEDLLAEAGVEQRPDPWLEGRIHVGDWTFDFPVPTAVAMHETEEGRYLLVDARDRVEFHWDPPAGIGKEALMAGISRTLSDLGLPDPPGIAAMEIVTATC